MAEKLRNCKGCGRVFMSKGAKFCPACIDKQHEDEQRIIDYVSDNPNCTILDIVKALGIQEGVVRRLIEEGRLLQAGIDFFYPCERCGAPIAAGQYCADCAEKLKAEIAEMQARLDAREGVGYHSKHILD